MKTFKYSIAFNLLGKFWLTAANFLFVPFYVRYLGLESYGLVGFYTSLLALLSLFDLGLSTTLSRELAKSSDGNADVKSSADTIRTLEVVYWMIAIAISILAFYIAPFIATYWFNSETISVDILRQSLILIGISISLRFPSILYVSGLQGVQKQFHLNLVSMIIETLRIFVSIFTLQKLSTDVRIFFFIQLFFNWLYTVANQFFLWQTFPRYFIFAKVNFSKLKKLWSFSASISLFSIAGAALIQLDKVLFSKLLTLQEFGIYSLSANIAYLPHYLIMAPIYFAIFPYFSKMLSENETAALVLAYHKISQFSVILVASIGFLVFFFPYEIIFLWVGDPQIAEKASKIVKWFALGTVLHSVVHLPYALKFAHGWTSLAVKFNFVAAVLFLPLLLILFPFFGPSAGGIAWLFINIVYFIFMVALIHQRLLPSEKNEWYIFDTCIPMFCMFFCGALLKSVQHLSLSGLQLSIQVLANLFCIGLAGVFSAKYVRLDAYKLVSRIAAKIMLS